MLDVFAYGVEDRLIASNNNDNSVYPRFSSRVFRPSERMAIILQIPGGALPPPPPSEDEKYHGVPTLTRITRSYDCFFLSLRGACSILAPLLTACTRMSPSLGSRLGPL